MKVVDRTPLRSNRDALRVFDEDGFVAIEGVFSTAYAKAAVEDVGSSASSRSKPVRFDFAVGQSTKLVTYPNTDSVLGLILRRINSNAEMLGLSFGPKSLLHTIELAKRATLNNCFVAEGKALGFAALNGSFLAERRVAPQESHEYLLQPGTVAFVGAHDIPKLTAGLVDGGTATGILIVGEPAEPQV